MSPTSRKSAASPEEVISPIEFMAFLAQLRVLNTVIAGVDDAQLKAFINACEHANIMGPYVDPTAWLKGHENLDMIVRAARLLANHKFELDRLAKQAGG